MELFYKDYGAGHPLVILHGLLGASGNWHSLSRNTFATHYHVFTVDQRNHGRSPHSAVFDYPTMAGDLLGFMDARHLAAAHLMGHSMGGKTAMYFALRHPERVSKLIIVDIAPRAYPPHHTYIFEALRSLDLAAYQNRSDIDEALAPHIASSPVRQFLLKNLASDGAGQFSWKMNLDGIYQNYPHLNATLDLNGQFEGPTLIIRGGRSDYIQDADLEAIRRAFPAAELITIPRAGHWVHAEAPQPFAEAVLAFLNA